MLRHSRPVSRYKHRDMQAIFPGALVMNTPLPNYRAYTSVYFGPHWPEWRGNDLSLEISPLAQVRATSRHPDRGFPPRLTPPAQRIRHIECVGAVTLRNQGPTRPNVLGFVERHIRRPVRPAYANQAQTEPAPAAHHNRIFVPSSSTYLQCLILYRRLVTGPLCTVSITL